MAKIAVTSDLDQFTTVTGNRTINKNHVAGLKKSIRDKNLLEYSPIVVNEKMEVIDGQHRLEAARQLNLRVYYIVADGLTFDDIVRLNTNVKDWSITDYLESYVKQGVTAYIDCQDFAKRFGLSVSNSIAILSMNGTVTSAGYRQFKEGSFEIKDWQASVEFAKKLRAVAAYTTKNTWKDRDFIRALSKALKTDGFDFEVLGDHLKTYPQPLHRRANVTEYLRQFEDVYNFGLSASRLRLY